MLGQITAGERPYGEALEILCALKMYPMTVEVLHKTRIGLTVNDLRKKSTSPEVQTEAKNLIRSWKKLIDSKMVKGGEASAIHKNDSVSSNLSELSRGSVTPPEPPSGERYPNSGRRSPAGLKGSNASTTGSGAHFRDKCREMIFKSLETDQPVPGSLNRQTLAAAIEESIFNLFKDYNEKYRACIRSRVFNLRDKKNPELKENVLTGALSPLQLATMTSEEMASDTMKALRKKFTREAIDEHQLSQEGGTPTDMFKCGKCGKKNCTYRQAQTRSADEPMTTFVYCRECGNRWKFC
uniref:Transcription elongation factor n=1 Tax=Trichuris muris TaxID=70415 RepID=A0A5S6R0Y2_TRIMR